MFVHLFYYATYNIQSYLCALISFNSQLIEKQFAIGQKSRTERPSSIDQIAHAQTQRERVGCSEWMNEQASAR
jgi:hypothetical protein